MLFLVQSLAVVFAKLLLVDSLHSACDAVAVIDVGIAGGGISDAVQFLVN